MLVIDEIKDYVRWGRKHRSIAEGTDCIRLIAVGLDMRITSVGLSAAAAVVCCPSAAQDSCALG